MNADFYDVMNDKNMNQAFVKIIGFAKPIIDDLFQDNEQVKIYTAVNLW